MKDFKPLSTNKIVKEAQNPEEEMEAMDDLLAKDPKDETRPCTIQEAMNMCLNVQEANYKERIAQEK